MTRKEAVRQEDQASALMALGFTRDESETLRRISITLQHWGERECNEDIETRDDGSAWLTVHGMSKNYSYRIPNREAGALRRLSAILKPHSRRLTYYHQGDPRGAALYIVRRADWRRFAKRHGSPVSLDCCYNSVGLAVY